MFKRYVHWFAPIEILNAAYLKDFQSYRNYKNWQLAKRHVGELTRDVGELTVGETTVIRAKSILKEKYGKNSELVKAYTKQIFDLPTIPNANIKRIHEFCEKLSYAVQSLETMGSLEKINGNVAMTLDKLSGIRGDLVRNDSEWESWDFVKLTEAGLTTSRAFVEGDIDM